MNSTAGPFITKMPAFLPGTVCLTRFLDSICTRIIAILK
jgi:hypothetical protein